MNWYKRIIAQDITAYLESLGADSTIIQFITSQEPNTSQLLTNEFRKNPGLTIEQLQQIQFSQKSDIDPYLERERKRATVLSNDGAFQQWVLVNYRRIRKGILPPENSIDQLHKILNEVEYSKYLTFDEILDQIADWYNAIQPDIASFSPEQAIAASDEWHRAMAGEGEGKEYEPTKPEMIIYGPEWKNPEWNGWTIQRVMSENDLSAEGNKMDNCVGSYCQNVQDEFSIIYSLRDPGNNPHITMETDDFHGVKQIQGKSNSIPKKEYQVMIKEWIQSNKNTKIEGYSEEDDPFEEINTSYGTAEDVLNAIERVTNDDYGLQRDVGTEAIDIMNLSIDMMDRSREPRYWGDWTSVPEASINMMLKQYENDPRRLYLKMKILEQELYKKEEEMWDHALNDWDTSWMDFPNEEDYATPEEFEAAEEKFREQESDYVSEELRKTPTGGYAYDAIAYINKLKEQGMIPEYKTEAAPAVVGKSGNWYKFIIAQNVIAYLESLGATPDIIQFITSQGANSQRLVNEFRKNPGITIEQLESFQFPQEEIIEIHLEREKYKVSTLPEMKQWLLVNYRKLRKGKMPPNGDPTKLNDMLGHQDAAIYWNFDSKIDEIVDWFKAIQPDLASFSPEQAIAASDEWHNMMAAKGDGKYYEPTIPELIVYGPEWEREPLWQGWTIQKIISKNDLLVEGSRMNNCVGSYHHAVASGDVNIYSLRSPSNKPVATIETDGDGNNVNQIKGVNNTIPDEDYRAMIYSWIVSGSEAPTQWKEKESGWDELNGTFDNIASGLIDLDNGYIENQDIDDDDYWADEYGLDLPGDPEFAKWTNNFNIPELMNNIFETMGYEYSDGDPYTINWHEEPFIETLIKIVKNNDIDLGKEHSSNILRGILKNKINDVKYLINDIDKRAYHEELVQASFAQYVLDEMYRIPEGQMAFEFAHGKNWYKKAQREDIRYSKLLGPAEDNFYYVKAIDTNVEKVIGVIEIYKWGEYWVAEFIKVLPEYRRKGVGAALMSLASEYVGGNLITDYMNATVDDGMPLLDSLKEKGFAIDFEPEKDYLKIQPNNKKYRKIENKPKYQVGEDILPYYPERLNELV